jgi:leucyl/phenylalanyl-tRNA--protein transferase
MVVSEFPEPAQYSWRPQCNLNGGMFASRKTPEPDPFPPVDEATDEGLLSIGGDLSAERLLLAYRSGIFPWFEEGLPVLWWSPDPRGVLELNQLRVTRRLQRTIRQDKFRVTMNECFEQVMRGCGDREEGTWITGMMLEAYCELHARGFAHSVETWIGNELVGGIYGVAIGGFFAGESMFYRVRDASKVALVHLVQQLRKQGYALFDVQILNEHTARLGGIEIPRERYLERLEGAINMNVQFL